MDADTLRTILDAQAANQQSMLRAIMDDMRGMFSNKIPSQTAAHSTSTEFIINSLSGRLLEFAHDPENGCTFDIWYGRYEDIIRQDGASLDDAAKARLIVSKLDAAAYARFSNHILPKKPADIPLENTLKILQELFGHNTSVFARRYAYLRTKCNGETLRDYTGLVNRRHEMAEFNAITAEQMKCLVWICGLAGQEYAEIRMQALRKLECNPHTTLRELSSEIQQTLDIRQDAKLLGNSSSVPTPIPDVNAVKVEKHQHKEPPSPCYRCGGAHWAKECSFTEKRCHACNRIGHKKGFCRNFNRRRTTNPKKNTKRANRVVVIASTTDDNTPVNRIYRTVKINEFPTRMRLDTGADITLLSYKDWISIGRPKLQPAPFKLKSANNKEINVRGFFKCTFVIEGHRGEGNCHVADTTSLLGMDWITQVKPLFSRLTGVLTCNAVSASTLATLRKPLISRLQKQFATVFTPGLGCCTKSKVSLKLKPNTTPVFRKARPVPYAVQPRIAQEIDRLVATNVLTPVDHSDWAAPIVVVQKKNGSIRLCADFSTGLNDALEQHQHPLPTPDDIFAKLNGGHYFSQLDLAEAYFQLEMDEDSRRLLTINTHRGLYRLNRLPFGVKSAPGIFQQQIDTLVAGLEGTAAYLDDIIVTGTTIDEHNERLEALFRRIHEYGFRVRLEKCSFLQTEIRYLGFIINADGRRPDPSKIEAIHRMPPPKDVTQLRAFLGLINFYGTFVKELHRLRAPLDVLTKKDVSYSWTPECQSAFDRIKATLKSDLLLTHYDPKLPIIVAADASNHGVGAVLSHRFPNGSEKAIYHASRTLTPAQKKYSQIEKEALAIIFAVQKFHRFIHGRHFTLKTDHKPLVSIFGSKKGVPVYSANRLQRWATILLNYDFNIEYVKTSDFGQADALSRLMVSHSPEPEDRVIAAIDAEIIAEIQDNCNHLPLSFKAIQIATAAGRVLTQVAAHTRSGRWPKLDRNSPLWPYYNRRESLSTVDSCLLTSSRLVIPKSLQHRVLHALHKAHPGQTRMKMLARSFVYWPSIDTDIENLVRNCNTCAKFAKNPVKAELQSWPKPTTPWSRVHVDFAGPLDGISYLVIVDAYSKWPEIIRMDSVSTSSTIRSLTRIFAQFGNPQTLITDNGSQFTSMLFTNFCKTRGIKHVRSPPFHPQSNGQAERFVDTFKRGLAKLKSEERITDALQAFLMAYRSTPCPSSPNHLSPAENFLGRRLRTELNLMMPPIDDNTGQRDVNMEEQFNRRHGSRRCFFDVDDAVYARDYRGPKDTWTPGIIVQRLGNVIYRVRCEGLLWTRHVNQLRPRDHTAAVEHLKDVFDLNSLPATTTPRYTVDDSPTPTSHTQSSLESNSSPHTTTSPISVRRSSRIRHAPHRINVDPKKKSYD